MNKKQVTILIILAMAFSVGLPLFLKTTGEKPNYILELIAALISAMASFSTLALAIMLFNKYGIETPLIERNSKVVFEFLEEFKRTRFAADGRNSMVFIRTDWAMTTYEKVYGTPLLFSQDYHLVIEKLVDLSESPFMPISIADKAKKLSFTVLTMVGNDDNKYADHSVITGLGGITTTNKGLFDSQEMTLMEFLIILQDIKTAIVEWIKINSNFSADLNV